MTASELVLIGIFGVVVLACLAAVIEMVMRELNEDRENRK